MDVTNRIVEQQFLAREDGLQRCVKLYSNLRSSRAKHDPDNANLYGQHLMIGLMKEQQDITALGYAMQAAAREAHTMTVQSGLIEQRTEETRNEVTALRQKLEWEQARRAEREEYAALSEQISALPSRASTLARMAQIDEQLDELKVSTASMTDEVTRRRKEFVLLFHALGGLRKDAQEEMESNEKTAETENTNKMMDTTDD